MDIKKTERQYGLWESPVSPISLARGITLAGLSVDQSGAIAWLEMRSDRGVLVVLPADGQASRDLNDEFSVRARVGYGGGDFTLDHGYAYFTDANSGRIYRQSIVAGAPVPITPGFGQAAAPTLSPDGSWMVFVHHYEGQDRLAVVDAEGKHWPQILVSGDDFYMQPTWHPQGDRLAWIAWNHPNMPWDGAWLRLGVVETNSNGMPCIRETSTLAGDEGTSVFQPEFSPDGKYLAYVSEESGWWQIYLHNLASAERRQLTFAAAEHGFPAWVQGIRSYGFTPDGRALVFIRNEAGKLGLWQYDLDANREFQIQRLDNYTSFDHPRVAGSGIFTIASGGRTPSRLIKIAIEEDQQDRTARVLRRTGTEEILEEEYSAPQPVTWQGLDKGDAHGLYYPPVSTQFIGSGSPPLVVRVHGGPTSQVRMGFNPGAQYFTSRGYAVLEVNHRGSTGYGRAYRDMLRGNWGLYDVQDSISGAQALADRGQVDLGRIIIMGGSAGGFTVLKALEDYPGFFKAGVCLFGVSNHFTLAAETHKFEARYSDSLLGPLPEASQVYYDRSPIFFVDRIKDPMAVYQGEIDIVVPRKQSDEVVESLARRGIPHIYHVYAGEGHGFRKAETIEHFWKTLDQFLRQYVIFT